MPENCFCLHPMGLHWFNTGNCTECACTVFRPHILSELDEPEELADVQRSGSEADDMAGLTGAGSNRS